MELVPESVNLSGDKYMDIDYVAKLARIRLTKEEKEKFGRQLDGIIHYMEKLNQLDTKAVEPIAHILGVKNVWREDKNDIGLKYELLKRIMPEEYNGFFKVPPVIE